MITNKEVEVKTKIDGVMTTCPKPAIVPFYPESVKDLAELFKNDTNAMGCLQRGLTIHYQAVVRGQYSERVVKDSEAKLELIAKTQKQGYYKEAYATMTVRAIMDDVLNSLPSK
jgi:hypothetical protein